MPDFSKLPRTKYLLEKGLNIADGLTSMKKNYFCPKCQRDIPLNAKECPNDNCAAIIDFKTQKKKGFYYVHFNIKEVLEKNLQSKSIAENLLCRVNLRNNRAQDNDFVSDIMDGEAYKQLGKTNSIYFNFESAQFSKCYYLSFVFKGLINEDFSLTMNTDGVNIYQSSTFSIWPIFLSINELEYRLRRYNFLLQ